jgi:hypothetical protein
MQAPASTFGTVVRPAADASAPALIHAFTFSPPAKLLREPADLSPLRRLLRRGDGAAQDFLDALGALSTWRSLRGPALRLRLVAHSHRARMASFSGNDPPAIEIRAAALCDAGCACREQARRAGTCS